MCVCVYVCVFTVVYGYDRNCLILAIFCLQLLLYTLVCGLIFCCEYKVSFSFIQMKSSIPVLVCQSTYFVESLKSIFILC